MADIRNNFSLNPIGAGGHSVPTRFLDGYLSMKQDQKSKRYNNILQCVQTENGLTSLSYCHNPILEMLSHLKRMDRVNVLSAQADVVNLGSPS